MIPLFHCRNCKINFEFPMKITNGYDLTFFVCPNCKSRDWGNIAE